MDDRVQKIIDNVFRREGVTFTNDPVDRGGATKYGVTQSKFDEWRRKREEPLASVAELEADEARELYRAEYVVGPGFETAIADERLLELVVDCGVHHGERRSARWLQAALGVKVDGRVGEKTGAAVAAADTRRVYVDLIRCRIEFFGRLITNDPSQSRFAAGWFKRCGEFLEALASW